MDLKSKDEEGPYFTIKSVQVDQTVCHNSKLLKDVASDRPYQLWPKDFFNQKLISKAVDGFIKRDMGKEPLSKNEVGKWLNVINKYTNTKSLLRRLIRFLKIRTLKRRFFNNINRLDKTSFDEVLKSDSTTALRLINGLSNVNKKAELLVAHESLGKKVLNKKAWYNLNRLLGRTHRQKFSVWNLIYMALNSDDLNKVIKEDKGLVKKILKAKPAKIASLVKAYYPEIVKVLSAKASKKQLAKFEKRHVAALNLRKCLDECKTKTAINLKDYLGKGKGRISLRALLAA